MIRVLHVHEDAEQLRYMKLLLEASERDIEVESLDNPADVPIRLLNGTFDAVLSGCWFPEMNEIELGVAVGRVKDIPFIMYNGEGREKAARDTLRRGVDDIVGKDVNPGHAALADKLVEAVNRNRRNRRREVSLNVFRALNLGSDLQSSLGETLRVIQEDMRIDAVGIRLQEGDDYPYFVFEGFHDKHILLENDLCATDLEGQMMRDDVGNPVLDCMCGNILRGRFNPSKPFFTERGSFWTNSTTEEERLTTTRNTCQSEGYESVALIPIRDDGETIGLLQLNDRRPGCFDEETIGFLEGLGKVIGESLVRGNRGREALEEMELIRETLRSAPIPSLIIDPDDMIIIGASYSAAQMLGAPLKELRGVPCYVALKGDESVCEDYGEECPLMQMLERRGQASQTVNPRTGKAHEGRYIEESASPIRGPDGAIELAFLMVREDPGPSRAL